MAEGIPVAYTVPNFNLIADHWRFIAPLDFDTKVYVGTLPCQLRSFGRNPHPIVGNLSTAPGFPYGVELLCEAGTDIRDSHCPDGVPDLVEVPVGTGRWYYVFVVDDVGKGFSNEYRYAVLGKVLSSYGVANAPDWPVPIP